VVWTWPTPGQWLIFVSAGVLGSTGHFCLTHSLKAADMSATQSVKFLDLIWATMWGYLVFGDTPAGATLAGGVVIIGATVWIARREARLMRQPPTGPGAAPPAGTRPD
jgi:drug/metabolite transporter (DMT)-like permease